jgi:primosomal protein N' (replication factor Y)
MSADLIEVLVPIPLLERFSYLLPKHLQQDPPMPGTRVLVPFGRRTLVGVVWKINVENDAKGRKYKRIKEVIDDEPLLKKDLLDLADWASRYYHYPLGEVISYFFTPSLRKGKDAKFLETAFWNVSTEGEFIKISDLKRAPNQQKAIELLREKGELAQIAAKAYGVSLPTLKSLESKGLVSKYSRELSQNNNMPLLQS